MHDSNLSSSETQATGDELRAALAHWETFARAIPHELTTPLSLIDAFAMLLQERESANLSERGRRHLEHLRQAAAHALSLGEALLVLAPLSLHTMRWQPVDLSALASQVMNLQRPSAPHRKLNLTVQPGLVATGDPALLRTLLANLLGNAWKFTAPQEVARIEFSLVSGPDGRPAFCVADNGVGFDMAQAADLFKPFKRLHALNEFAGSGLGLAIARRVVERHGGSIWAEAAEGEGARVLFVLDAARRPADGPPTAPRPS